MWAVAIAALAAAVRIWGIAFGLPYDLTADEPHQIIQALKVGAGEGGPLVKIWHTVGKGGLDYLLFFEYGVLYVTWLATGRIDSPRDFALVYLQDPTAFYLVGRLTVAALGTLTCVLAFAVGRRIYGTAVGAGAALLGAVAYHHAADSHLINVHVPMACALWGAVLVYTRYEDTGRRRLLVAAGLLSGIAVALAYTAAVVVLMLLLLLVTNKTIGTTRTRLLRGALFAGAATACVALMSPALITNAGLLLNNFSQILGLAAPRAGEVRDAIDSVTILGQQNWARYPLLLLTPYNALTTVAAIGGAIVGMRRRERWTIALTLATGLLLLILSASNRGLNEAYLLPVTPALWLLASRGLSAGLRRTPAFALGLALTAAIPLFAVVRDDVMVSQPDTRVIAKAWIETHVPAGARILMDGMRFRFVQGAPLTPDARTVERRLTGLESSELALSDQMISLYREAASRASGPTYELHSTVYGLEVQDLDYYVRERFDYVVVSSFNEKRYDSPASRLEHPHSVRFYDGLKHDPRFRKVYVVEPVVWQQSGPTITVYQVTHGSTHVSEAP